LAPELEVRTAGPSDADEVAALLAGFRDYYGESEPDDGTIRRVVGELIGDEATEFLLAGDPPAGVAQLRFRLSVWTGAHDAWLEDLFVAESARRDGVGAALLEVCVERARERGCKRIQLDANERNEAALPLYERFGFSSAQPRRWQGGRDLYWTLWL
jgi:GNAT superfamily N-acetyltransferase